MLILNLLLGATMIATSTAHPWIRGASDVPVTHNARGGGRCPFGSDKVNQMEKRNGLIIKNEKQLLSRQSGGSGLEEAPDRVLTGAGGLLEGLLGSVADLRGGEMRVPDADHPFREPGPTDQRGPCPGLNALANHGYISRSGIVSADKVIESAAEAFNMGTDLSTLSILSAVALGGNIETLEFSLGGEDNRTYSPTGIGSRQAGRQLGLAGHSRCEGDISAIRRDYFTNNGDNHNAYPDRFKRFIELARKDGGEFNVAVANALYGQNAQESIRDNDKLFFNSYTILVILGQYPLIPALFGNGTQGSGGVANYESISSFYGMQTNPDGIICYVPVRFPENWYRRATPYGVVDLIKGLAGTYFSGPELVLPTPLGVFQNPDQSQEIGCAIYQGVAGGIPTALAGETREKISQTVTFLQNRLLPALPSVYGCSPDAPSMQADGPKGEQGVAAADGGQGYGQICA